MSDSQGKAYYKIGEVCELTGTQPYVLRFWESEFATLAPEKNRSGQRVYRQCDIALIEKIKVLLYEKEYTIAGARKVLETERMEDERDSALMAGEDGGQISPSADPRSKRGTAHASVPPQPGRDPRQPPQVRAEISPELLFRSAQVIDHQLEAEVRNLRAKLSHAEAELRGILSAMGRHDDV